jgi:hypothetical protein
MRRGIRDQCWDYCKEPQPCGRHGIRVGRASDPQSPAPWVGRVVDRLHPSLNAVPCRRMACLLSIWVSHLTVHDHWIARSRRRADALLQVLAGQVAAERHVNGTSVMSKVLFYRRLAFRYRRSIVTRGRAARTAGPRHLEGAPDARTIYRPRAALGRNALCPSPGWPTTAGPSIETVSRRICGTSAAIPTTPLPSRRTRH